MCPDFIFYALLSLFFQNVDDLLVASAECPSDDEDLEECEPGNGESTLSSYVLSKNKEQSRTETDKSHVPYAIPHFLCDLW